MTRQPHREWRRPPPDRDPEWLGWVAVVLMIAVCALAYMYLGEIGLRRQG